MLPEVFSEYHRRFPAVQISIYRNFSRKILERVEEGSLDVGIVTLPVKSNSLKVHPIFRDRLMLMTSSDNPLGKKESVTIAEGRSAARGIDAFLRAELEPIRGREPSAGEAGARRRNPEA